MYISWRVDFLAKSMQVVSVVSKQLGLLQHYCFVLQVLVATELNFDSMLGLRGHVICEVDGDPRYFPGVIRLLQFINQTAEGYHYLLQVASPLELLAHGHHNRVFVGKTVRERVETVLRAVKFYPTVQWHLNDEYPADDLRIQYQENDLLFFQRQLSEWGLVCVFDGSTNQPMLHIADDVKLLPQSKITKLNFIPDSGMSSSEFCVSTIVRHRYALPETIVCHDYNPELSTTELTISASNKTHISGFAETHRYGDHFSDYQKGKRVVAMRRDALDCQREKFVLQTNCPLLQVGQFLSIMNHRFSGNFQVLDVQHQYHDEQSLPYQQEISAEPGYRNTLTLLASERRYRPNIDDYPKTKHGLLTATIEGVNDHVFLDQQGRYRLRYAFDQDNPAAQASPPVRKAEIQSGANYGMHMPLKPGSEVIVLCVNGDIDRPIILGAVPNAHNPSVVTDNNSMQHIIRTHAGHQLLMDDQKNFTYAMLSTTNSQEMLKLSAKTKQHHVMLQSNMGDINIKAGNTLLDQCGSHFEQTVGGDYLIQTEQDYKVTTQHGDICHSAGENVEMLAEHGINITSQTSDIHQQAGNDFLMHAEKNFQLLSANDITITTEQGDVILQGAKSISLSARKRMVIQQGGSKILIDDEGIRIEAPEVNLMGDTVSLQSPTIDLGGSATMKPVVQTAPTEHLKNYFMRVQYSQLAEKILPPTQTMTLNHEFNGTLNQHGIAQATAPDETTLTTLALSSSEIIAINNKNYYPNRQINLTNNAWRSANPAEFPSATANDQQASAQVLFPPIIKQLATAGSHLLSADELAYFKHNGNNAMIFVHGFNVSEGEFAKEILDISVITNVSLPDITYGSLPRTVYCSLDLLKQQFPQVSYALDNALLPTELHSSNNPDDDQLNGTGAHNWFIHIEDNLNRATGQFDYSDYKKYTRCIHTIWAGDVGLSNYMQSEINADAAAPQLVELLLQLHNAGIAINIIAHSMGNRVMMQTLQQLADKHQLNNVVDHIFMWQAALPDTALSSNKASDLSVKRNCSFPAACNAVKKITVFYDNNDELVLSWAYRAMNKIYQDIIIEEARQTCQKNHRHTYECHLQKDRVLPALGVVGPDKDTINELKDKLIRADMTPWASGHSYMHIPNQDVIQHGYEHYIMNPTLGIQKFGLYDSNKFPKV